MNDYLAKPISPSELYTKIASWTATVAPSADTKPSGQVESEPEAQSEELSEEAKDTLSELLGSLDDL